MAPGQYHPPPRQLDHHWAEVVAACVQAGRPPGLSGSTSSAMPAVQRPGTCGTSMLGSPLTGRRMRRRPPAASRCPTERARRRRGARPTAGPSLRREPARDGAVKTNAAIATAKGGRHLGRAAIGAGGGSRTRGPGGLRLPHRHQQERASGDSGRAARRKELKASLAQFDAALDCTRAEPGPGPGR